MSTVNDERRVERFDVVTEDPGEIDEVTRLMFGAAVRVERSDGRPPSLRLGQAATGELGVQRVTWNVDGRCDVGPLDRFLCIRLRRGACGLDQGDGRAMYAVGDTFLVDPSRKVDAEVIGADLDSFTIDRAALESVAFQISPLHAGRLAFRQPVPVSAELARVWDGMLNEVAAALRGGDLIATNPLIRALLLHRFVATACTAFALLEEDEHERPATARSIRRAVAYIEEHLADPISVGDIAAAAGMSTRGLHAAFQRVLGTSPYVYLRRARLHAARQDLLAAGDSVTVSDVALRWGFAHFGRFSGTYREEFGELPSATLRS